VCSSDLGERAPRLSGTMYSVRCKYVGRAETPLVQNKLGD